MSNPLHPDDCYTYIVLISTGSIGMVPRGTHPGIGDLVKVSWLDEDGVEHTDEGYLDHFIQVLED